MTGHISWTEVKKRNISFLTWELKLLRQVIPENQYREVCQLLLDSPCACGHPRREHVRMSIGEGWRLGCTRKEPRCSCRTYSYDEFVGFEADDENGEVCGESYDHDLDTIYEGPDGRQFVCKNCGAEIWEDPE